MKAIESPLIGRKAVLAKDPYIMRFQVQQILNAHRDTLINSLLKDVPYFLAYRFHAKATATELQEIESKLMQLKTQLCLKDCLKRWKWVVIIAG